jgi:hypothetical protein
MPPIERMLEWLIKGILKLVKFFSWFNSYFSNVTKKNGESNECAKNCS